LRNEVENKETAERLPSRSEIHAEKRKKTKWKMNFPVVRLLGIAFILIPITILAIHFNNTEENFLHKILPPRVESYEQINISKSPAAAKTAVNSDEADEEESEEIDSKNAVEEKQEDKTETINTSGETTTEKTATTDPKTNTGTTTTANKSTEPEEKVIDKEKIEENVEYIEHVVGNGETLYRISMKYYNSRSGEKIISDYNDLINNQVNVGQTLIIPLKKE
jgi:cytoskeletal protein RodZ